MNDDRSAFENAMRGVQPLTPKPRAASERRKPAPRRRAGAAAARGPATRALDRQTLRALTRGRMQCQAHADLHGLTGPQALRVLEDFIAEAVRDGLKCVRVVHGKGKRSGPAGPVLQAVVHRWLASSEDVLAFAPAAVRDGGSGAVYVLLKR